jgi:glycosyltransferase involved in cell wall biosynthesis
MDTPVQTSAVAHFTECYQPIVNGVVASIDALRAGLEAANVDVTIVAPHFPHERNDRAIVRLPSFPLPTQTGYRLCVPHLSRAQRARIARASIVHVHSPFVTGTFGADIARRYGRPLVFTYHTRIDEYAHYAPFEPRVVRRAMTALTRAFANRADVVIVPTAAMRQRLRAIGVRARIEVIASAIDVARFSAGRRTAAARAALGARDGERVALCVSRIAKEKRIGLAVDALAHTRDLRLAIVGDGPERAALEQRARDLGVRERVHFLGALEHALLPDLYAASDAFVFPSASETQGLVVAEAMAAGLPVVAAEDAVNREVLGGCGRLVAPDPAAFARDLERAVEQPRDAAAAAEAGRRFDSGRQAAAVLNLYRSLSLCRTFGTLTRDYAPGAASSH